MVKYLYRINAKIGNGGTADVLRSEFNTGNLYSKTGHIQKAIESRKALKIIINDEKLSPSDLKIAIHIIEDNVAATRTSAGDWTERDNQTTGRINYANAITSKTDDKPRKCQCSSCS